MYKVCLTVTDSCGTDSICKNVSVSITGISEAMAIGSIKVYPNPNAGVFTVSFTSFGNEKIELSIIDILGRNILEEIIVVNSDTEKKIDISKNPKGSYFIRIKIRDSVVMEKLFFE